MKNSKVKINNKLGLHARAAAKFVKIASGFQSEIMIRRPPRSTQSRSSAASDVYKRQIMMLAAGMGTEINIIAIGVDESEAIISLQNLVDDKFGENE